MVSKFPSKMYLEEIKKEKCNFEECINNACSLINGKGYCKIHFIQLKKNPRGRGRKYD